MRYHLDTSFLVDWQRQDPLVEQIVQDILAGVHSISFDPIAHTEFVAARVVTPRKQAVLDTLYTLGTWTPISIEATRQAAGWLARLNDNQRRAFFADALIAATASDVGATLLTGDKTAASMFPIPLDLYHRE